MKQISKAQWLLWPSTLLALSLIVYIFQDLFFQQFAPNFDRNAFTQLSIVAIYFSTAWLVARIIGSTLKRTSPDRRRSPKLLRDLITAALFLAATIATVAMQLGQSAGGALASSGLIIAILGFAIRNVLADVFSGIALGLEAPFRIGDWIDINGDIRGRVIEIGWRTTRILTRSDTYMIVPNSQISRQKMTNYSAPRKHYRASVEIILGHDISVERGKTLLAEAALTTDLMVKSKKPDVRTVSYDTEGVRYAIRYWVPSFVDDVDYRDTMLVAVDATIRKHGFTPPCNNSKHSPHENRSYCT